MHHGRLGPVANIVYGQGKQDVLWRAPEAAGRYFTHKQKQSELIKQRF